MHQNRYERQTCLPEIGERGQEKLAKSRVLMVGAGGLAAPNLQSLVGAGIGELMILDDDLVSLSNLHRQTLFKETDIDKPKAECLTRFAQNLNSEVKTDYSLEKLGAHNVAQWVSKYDLILDCGDQFALSYILSDECFKQQKPLISSSVLGFEAYVGGYCKNAPSIRAIFPNLPKSAQNCAGFGVVGSMVGMIGHMQSQIAINYLLELEPNPMGQLIRIDGKNLSLSKFDFSKAAEPKMTGFPFTHKADIRADDLVIELRDQDEQPKDLCDHQLRILPNMIEQKLTLFEGQKRVIFICRSGLRAWNAAQKIKPYFSGEIALIADI